MFWGSICAKKKVHLVDMSVGRNAQSVLNCECWQSSLAGTHEYSWHFSAPPPAKKIKTIMVYGITVVSMPASEFWSLDFESRVPTFSVGSMSSLWAFQHPSKLQNKHASLIEDSKSAVTNILPKGNQVAPTERLCYRTRGGTLWFPWNFAEVIIWKCQNYLRLIEAVLYIYLGCS